MWGLPNFSFGVVRPEMCVTIDGHPRASVERGRRPKAPHRALAKWSRAREGAAGLRGTRTVCRQAGVFRLFGTWKVRVGTVAFATTTDTTFHSTTACLGLSSA